MKQTISWYKEVLFNAEQNLKDKEKELLNLEKKVKEIRRYVRLKKFQLRKAELENKESYTDKYGVKEFEKISQCNIITVSNDVCTIRIKDVKIEDIVVSQEGKDVCIENISQELPCQKIKVKKK